MLKTAVKGGFYFSMGKLLNLISKFQKLDVQPIGRAAMTEVAPEFADKQREQLRFGESSTGGTLRKYRNPSYARMKNAMNPLPGLGNPDLRLTGAFHRGITAKVEGGKIVVSSSDSKAPELEAAFNEDLIYGLHPESRKEFINADLRPAFMRNIRKEIKL